MDLGRASPGGFGIKARGALSTRSSNAVRELQFLPQQALHIHYATHTTIEGEFSSAPSLTLWILMFFSSGAAL
jgi:hypothetical protein